VVSGLHGAMRSAALPATPTRAEAAVSIQRIAEMTASRFISEVHVMHGKD